MKFSSSARVGASTRSRGSWRRARACRKCSSRPGNAGTASEAEGSQCSAITETCRRSSTSRARRKSHLTVVGPEAPLAAGVVDVFRDAGSRSSDRRVPPRSSKASRISRKASWRGTASPPPSTAPLTRAGDAPGLRRAARRADRRQGRRTCRGQRRRRGGDVAEAHAAIDQMLLAEKLGRAGTRAS